MLSWHEIHDRAERHFFDPAQLTFASPELNDGRLPTEEDPADA